MRCSKCSTDLSPTARFCGRCGVTIEDRRYELPAEPFAGTGPLGVGASKAPADAGREPTQRSGGVLLLEAPPKRERTPVPPRPQVESGAPEPEPEPVEQALGTGEQPLRTAPFDHPRRPAGMVVAMVVAAVAAAALLGAFIGHRGAAAATADAGALRTRLADAASAQAALADQLATANGRLKAQKATEPLRRLVGKRAGKLQSYTQSHGWQLRIVKVASPRPAGTVLSQSLPPGHPMKADSVIVVRVAS